MSNRAQNRNIAGILGATASLTEGRNQNPARLANGVIVVFLAIAPITSITVIVIFVLIGSFRHDGDKPRELSSLFPLLNQSIKGAPE